MIAALRRECEGAKTPCRVALAGFGTVGQSVARLLRQAGEAEVRLVGVLNRRVAEKRVDWVGGDVLWTESIDELLDAGPDVFVELIGGRDPAEAWMRRALDRGISVVTANKEVIAHDGRSLAAAAVAHGAQLRFEGAVAGGVPVIRAIESGLASDNLTQIAGILNGTCNYILTRMEQGSAFDEALKEAQSLGFAEANPSQDVDGLDARAKLAILVMVAFGVHVPPSAIAARSIAELSSLDFLYARKLHCTIRQVAWATRNAALEGLAAGIGPALVPLTSPLARVTGSENLVTVTGHVGGQTSFGGRGAGGDPTSVAVVSDVLAIARGARPPSRHQTMSIDRVSDTAARPSYVRFTVKDRPGIIAALAAVFAAHDINIDAVLQEPGFPPRRRPFVVSLDAAPASQVHAALADIAMLDFHVVPPLAIPVLTAGAIQEVGA